MGYRLVRSKRRTVSLEIKNGELYVKAPYLAPKFMIEKFIAEKQPWIEKHLEKSKTNKKENREYKSGEEYLYFGEIKKLKTVEAGAAKVDGIQIFICAKNEIEAKTRLRKFYKAETARLVKKYLAKYSDEFDVRSPKITYRFYKSKWGSCSPKNDFSFNALLSMAPEETIEYVVIHELSHCKEKNHSKRFWAEVGQFDPNFKTHRKWLRENHSQLSI